MVTSAPKTVVIELFAFLNFVTYLVIQWRWFFGSRKGSAMKHYLLIVRITFIVLGLFCILLLVSGLQDLKEGKTYKARCTATTKGTVTYFYNREEREEYHLGHYVYDAGDTEIAYKFKVNSLELSGDRHYGKYMGDAKYSEGDSITVHYNPDALYENYPDKYCYHLEVAKQRLETVAIVWIVYILFLVIFIVRRRLHPEKFF